MNLSIQPDKREFFKKSLERAFGAVVKAKGSESPVPFALQGFGLHSQALLLLECLNGLPDDIPGDSLEVSSMMALIQAKTNGTPTEAGYLHQLYMQISREQARPTQEFHCMFFLQLTSLPAWITDTPILGLRIKSARSVAWRTAREQLGWACLQANIEEVRLAQMQAVEVAVRAKRSDIAIRSADQVCNILRGAHFLTQGNSEAYGHPGSSIHFKPSPLYFVRKGRSFEDFAYVPGCEILSLHPYETCPPVMSHVLKLLKKVPKEGSTHDLVSTALQLYASSGDTIFGRDRFLALWQTVEALSLASRQDTQTIARSFSNYWLDGRDDVRPRLLALSRFRNELVHLAKYDNERQSATFALNEIARGGIMRVAALAENLPTREHLINFQSLVGLTDSQFEVKKQVLAFVQKARADT